MQAKSERFELRLNQELMHRLDNWRTGTLDGLSRAEAARRLMELGLSASSSSAEEVHFRPGELLIVMMLRDLYGALKVKGDIDPDFVAEAIWGGHYWAFDWQYTGLFHDSRDKTENVYFVLDVLEMWEAIEESYAKLTAAEKKAVEVEAEPFGKFVEFSGFDGNNEGEYIGIARFLVEKMQRFTHFSGRRFNSHAPSVGPYRQMLDCYGPMKGRTVGSSLSKDQIVKLLLEQTHPDYR